MTATATPDIEIVAEIAQGFEGKPEQTMLLLRAAASAGADAAKFQLVYADELATPDYKYYELFSSLEMDDDFWGSLSAKASELGIRLQLDVFGTRSLGLAEALGVDTIKLHGTDTANVGFLRRVADSSVPRVMLGAGGAHLSEIERALDILKDKQVVLMLGFQGYPTSDNANEISRVRLFAERFSGRVGVTIGFADHAAPESPLRYALAAAAIGAGARMVEKHLTLGKVMQLEDHESALNPDEFAEFSTTVRGVASAMGTSLPNEDFGMSESEKGYRKMIRRHVIATRDLGAGDVIAPEDVELKRSSATDPPTDINAVYGQKLARAITRGEALLEGDLNA